MIKFNLLKLFALRYFFLIKLYTSEQNIANLNSRNMYFVILSAYNLLSTYSSVNQNLNFSVFNSLYIQHILPQNNKTVILSNSKAIWGFH